MTKDGWRRLASKAAGTFGYPFLVYNPRAQKGNAGKGGFLIRTLRDASIFGGWPGLNRSLIINLEGAPSLAC